MCYGIGFGYYQIAGCSDEIRKQMPSITFQIGSYLYNLRPEKYTTYKQWTKSCTINLYGTNDDKWVLGAPFLSDWYQVYDLKRSQMGLVPSIYVNNETTPLKQIPPESLDEMFTKLMVTILLSSALIIVSLTRNVLYQRVFVYKDIEKYEDGEKDYYESLIDGEEEP